MKVRELVAILNNHDPEVDVHFAYHSPDNETWLTPICCGVHTGHITYSWSYQSPKIVERLAEQSTAKEAVILFP